MAIVACPPEAFDDAWALVRRVFPRMGTIERLSHVMLQRPGSLAARALMRAAGIRDLRAFDVELDERGRVRATAGLYRYRADADDASWLAWFCVAPEARRRGLGQALLEHAERRSLELGHTVLRLYTSTDPNEAAAQRLYEKNGYLELARTAGARTTTIFREKRLGAQSAAIPEASATRA
jgi:GNAT superfamily N-acetyltransferase